MYESNQLAKNHNRVFKILIWKQEPPRTTVVNNPLLDVLDRRRRSPPPLWMMRQAGRYLPEYRVVREKAGDFLTLCFTPELAAEVTLQPVRRFGLDAAILFSDILVVPHALGQRVWFSTGEGPRLEPLADGSAIARLVGQLDQQMLAPIYETIERVKLALSPEVALLGFCGAPWTVASYMIAGRGTADQAPARLLAYRDPQAFERLIDFLVGASSGVSDPAGASWCRRRPDLRYLGRMPAVGAVSTLVHRADVPDHR